MHRFQGRPAEDVVLGDADPLQAERPQGLDQDQDAGHDSGCAVGMQPRDLPALGQRHGANVVGVMGNNGIWGLEKHPMEFLYGYSVAADLQPGCRYDQVVEALGGHGELVERPHELRPALERAFASGKPALVNVLTDPSVVYPRKANLA